MSKNTLFLYNVFGEINFIYGYFSKWKKQMKKVSDSSSTPERRIAMLPMLSVLKGPI